MSLITDRQLSESWTRLQKIVMVGGVGSVVIGLLVVFLLTGTAQAQGGGAVGSGGSGSNAGGSSGHWSWNGYGWVVYPLSGSGPTDDFRDYTTTWADVRAACNPFGASEVVAFIVNDAAGDGMVYDYQGWNNPANLLPVGSSADHGRATVISTGDALSRFTSLSGPPLFLNTSGFTWGSDVAWFCWNFAPPSVDNSTCTITGPASILPGQTFNVTVTANNIGTTTWTPVSGVGAYKVGAVGDRNVFGPARGLFSSTVSPGGSRAVNLTFTAPGTPGLYSTTWRTLQEGRTWFGGTCVLSVTVNVPSTLWDYDVDTSPSPACQVRSPGETFRVNTLAVNNGTGSGPGYTHRLYGMSGTDQSNISTYLSQVGSTGGGSVSLGGRTWSGVSALGAGSSVTRYIDYSVGLNATDGLTIFFMADVAGAAGQSTPFITTTDPIDTSRDGEGSVYTTCVRVLRLEYNYVPQSPTADSAVAGGQFYAGTRFGMSGNIRNDGNGTGPTYRQDLSVNDALVSGADYSTNHAGLPAPAPNDNRTFISPSNRWLIASNAAHGRPISCRNRVRPATGLSPPSPPVVIDGDESTYSTCVTVYNLRFNITTLDPNLVTFSSSAVLPGSSFTVDVDVCNTEGLPAGASGGVAPSVNVQVVSDTNVTTVTGVNNTRDVARQSAGSCSDAVTPTYTGSVSSTAGLGDVACVRVIIDKDEGFSDGYLTSGSQNYRQCVNVAEQSYVQAEDNSIWAGGNFDPSPTGFGSPTCAAPGSAYVRGARLGSILGYARYIVGSTGSISNWGSTSRTSNRLSFANTPSDGSFGQGMCFDNLETYLSQDTARVGISAVGNATTFPGASGQFVYNGASTYVISNETIPAGRRVTLIVDGDVRITDNIEYQNYTAADKGDIPSFILVATGDIDIEAGVTRLDGVYYSGAQIDTCTNQGARVSSGECRNQLIVNGIFTAEDIEFRRTYGGVSGTNPNGGNQPSEVFRDTEELYLADHIMISDYAPELEIDRLVDLPPAIN